MFIHFSADDEDLGTAEVQDNLAKIKYVARNKIYYCAYCGDIWGRVEFSTAANDSWITERGACKDCHEKHGHPIYYDRGLLDLWLWNDLKPLVNNLPRELLLREFEIWYQRLQRVRAL